MEDSHTSHSSDYIRNTLSDLMIRLGGPIVHGIISPKMFLSGLRFGSRFTPDISDYIDSPSHSEGILSEYFDDHTTGHGIWKWLHYFPVYERYLSPFRNKDVKLLEIGIFSGGSLQMWKTYLGPKARIYGVDIEPSCKSYEDDQTQVFIGDQADPAFWRSVISEIHDIDIIIDDGGHQTVQQIRTLEALLPNLRPGGIYICEDIHKRSNPFLSYIDGLSRNLHRAHYVNQAHSTTLRCAPSSFQQYIDSIHMYPFIVVIEMRKNTISELSAPMKGTQWQPFLHIDLPNER